MPNIFRAGQTDYISKLNIIASEFVKSDISATVGGTTTLDASLCSNFFITMGAGNTTVSFSNTPTDTYHTCFDIVVYVKQDGVGSRTVTWPGSVVWPSGTAPTLTTTANKIDMFQFSTLDGGTKFFGRTIALNYS